MLPVTRISTEHITKTAGVCGGKACIAGSRVRVLDVVVWHEHEGKSPEDVAAMFPSITLADVYAALAYYLDNREEIQADLDWEEQLIQRYQLNSSSKLQRQMDAEGGQG